MAEARVELHPVLADIVAAFDQAQIRWCCLRVPANPCAPESDIDFLIDPRHVGRARQLLSAREFVRVPAKGHSLHWLRYHQPTAQWLWLHGVTELAFGPAYSLKTHAEAGCLDRRSVDGPIAVLAPDDAFWALLFHVLLDRGAVSPHHRTRLQALAAQASVDSPLADIGGKACPPAWTPARIADAARAGQWQALDALAPLLKAGWISQQPLGAGRRLIDRGWRALDGLLSFAWWRRRGLSIALLGPDGAGKSTLAEGLRRSSVFPVRLIYMGLTGGALPYVNWLYIPGLVQLVRMSVIWGRYLRGLYHQARGRLVIFDRYIYDAMVPHPERLNWYRRVTRWIDGHSCPAPDMVLVLSAPGEVMYSRKGEYSSTTLEDWRQHFLALQKWLPHLELVDTTRTAEEVRADVMGRIWRRYAVRWRGRRQAASLEDERSMGACAQVSRPRAGSTGPDVADAEPPGSDRTSLLELLHPDGVAGRSLILGGNCPATLRPVSRAGDGTQADLIVLSPTVGECRTKGWLQAASVSVAQRLAPDGLIYVLAPSVWRSSIIKLLSQAGLSPGLSIAHLPNWDTNRHLMPLRPAPIQYAFANLLPVRSWARKLGHLAIRAPGSATLLATLFPSVGTVVRRPQARPLLAWLFEHAREGRCPGDAIVSTSWRGQDGTVTLRRFARNEAQPTAIAKVALTAAAACRVEAEGERLARLGPKASQSGARVPQLLSLDQAGRRPLLLQTAVSGQLVSHLLAVEPRRLLGVIDRVTDWLEQWYRASRTTHPLTRELLNEELLDNATLLAPSLRHGPEYLAWLTMRCADSVGLPVPLVATHSDLTMWNLLLDDRGGLGVVDWEGGRERALPLADFFYAMADAVAATLGYADRLKAYRACFTPEGRYAQAVVQRQERIESAIGLSPEITLLCSHACWLHHAANEHRAGLAAASRPFLQIVQWLADHRADPLFRPE